MSVPLDDGEVLLGHACAVPIALFQSRPQEILRKDLLLEHFGDPQFSSSLHLEPFELFDLVVEVEDHVSLLEKLGVVLLDVQLSGLLLLFGCGDHHRLVGAVYLEEDGHFLAVAVFPFFGVLQPLVLIIRIFVVNEVVEDVARIRYLQGFAGFEVNLDIFWKAMRKEHPNTVSVQL